MGELYNVVRIYRDKPGRKRVILEAVTLEQAQEHCRDPETSSSTCKGSAGRATTKRNGAWFDCYERRS